MATQIKSTVQTTTKERSEQGRDSLLRNVFKGNAEFSTLMGFLFIVFSAQVAEFIGLEDGSGYVLLLGVALLPFAAFVFYVATRPQIDRRLAQSIITMDFLWVIGSAVVLLTDVLALSTEGNWGVLIIADIVLTFAILQIFGLRRMNQ